MDVWKAKDVDRWSIIRLKDGKIAVWERKTMTAITSTGTSRKLKGDDEVDLVKHASQLAFEYVSNPDNFES